MKRDVKARLIRVAVVLVIFGIWYVVTGPSRAIESLHDAAYDGNVEKIRSL